MEGHRCPRGAISVLVLLLLFLGITRVQFTHAQETRGVGAGTLSSLVRALELSGQESVQAPTSRSFPPPRSRNHPPTASRFAPTSQSRFSPAAKPTRESKPVSSFRHSKPTSFQAKSSPEPPATKRPVATSNSEFRFGSNRPRPSSRITFIPQDRGARFSRPLLPHQAALAGKISKPSKPAQPVTTTRAPPKPKVKPAVTTKKPGNAYDYTYDEYYDEYYYYDDPQTNDSEIRGNQPEDLGPIDPPMTKSPPRPQTTQSNPTIGISTEAHPKLRFTTAAPRPNKSENKSSSGRKSLFERLASLGGKDDTTEAPRTANEIDSSRDGRILTQVSEQTTPQSSTSFQATTSKHLPITTTEPRVEIRVTNTTESTFVVANIQTSRSVSMRHETSADNTTPTTDLEQTPIGGDRSVDRESKLFPGSSQPSLTSIFEEINVHFDDDIDNTTEKSAFSPKSKSTTKVIDITTEAQKLSTTEKSDLPAFLDSIFDKARIDPSKLPPGFFSTPKSLSTNEASSTKQNLPFTTPKSKDNLFNNLLKPTDGNVSDLEDNTETVNESDSSPPLTKEELIFASLFGPSDSKTISASLLPKGFSAPTEKVADVPVFNVPIGKSDGVPAHLLPKGFNNPESSLSTPPKTSSTPETTEAFSVATTPYAVSKSPKGLIFPKRIVRPSFLTTTQRTTTPYVAPSGPELLRPTIVNIFDRIKTTPKRVIIAPTRPPKMFEELQAEVTPASTSSTSTTTTTTTTTTSAPPRPTTPGVCGEKCRLAGTLRIVNGVQWVPELANRDTKEWQMLASTITNELNAVYQRSRLSRWYVGVEIDSFNPGSVLVDYFLLLNDISTGLDTIDLKQIMNDMLENSNRAEYSLGPLTVDPEGTDFVVIKERQRSVVRDDGSYLIPEWLIAVIVISLASFLFIIIFGITVLVSRARVRKRNVPLTEEVLNKLNANQLAGVDNYHHDSIYDMEAIWDEKVAPRNMKPPSSRGRGYNPNYNINIYDSWRTDWSGPYGSSATYAKRRPEANF